MTARRTLTAIGAVALLGLLAACAVKHTTYPGGVRFDGLADGRFRDVSWDATAGATCPLTLHLPGGPLGPATLTDSNALATLGWVRHGHPDGGAHMRLETDDVSVDCNFGPDSRCAGVSLCFRADSWSPAAVVEVGGKTVTLPATDEELTAALGPAAGRWPDANAKRR